MCKQTARRELLCNREVSRGSVIAKMGGVGGVGRRLKREGTYLYL